MICAQCGQENPAGFRFCGACGAALVEAPPPREVRKTVTVLFCDVSGSTALGERTDPEALRHVMRRYFDEVRAAIERHGGTVEKFVGDAAMAVFGVPQLREDDALRAVRAADEIRRRLPALADELGVALSFRTGVNTGEVVVGEGQTLATGDAVNVAARLEQAAEPGEILLGAETRRLVRDAVEVEPVEPLALKGKARPVEAFRLVRVDPDAPALARRFDAPLVGRGRELALLRQAFERAVTERSCLLFTVLGAAGVGKSRLVAEFLAGVEDEARVVRGRCLHYGEGITFWPLVEALKQLGAEAPLDQGLAPADLFWQVRKLLEQEAQTRPLVLVFDDLHWAEPMFLDLLDHVADLARDAPILLCCVARPELLETRPGWGGGKLNATTALLDALSANECEQLLAALGDGIDEPARRRIVEASEGNPLFVEEMAALAREGDVTVPSTIQALLAARLDQLADGERSVIERGAVEGKVFHRGAVRELSPEPARAEVEAHLTALVRKELVRPERGPIAVEDAFRFRHQLIRDAAYDALPKELRAQLHERFAGWLDDHGGELVERDELVGFHLEQAVRYRRELGAEPEPALAARAARHLARAAKRAGARFDVHAAHNLYARAFALMPAGRERAALRVEQLPMLLARGEFAEAEAAVAEAEGCDDERVRLRAAVARQELALSTSPDGLDEQSARDLIARLERAGDEEGLAYAWEQLGGWFWLLSRMGPAREALLEAQRHVIASGEQPSPRLVQRAAATIGFGPFPFEDMEQSIRECESLPPTPAALSAIASGRAWQAMLAGRYEDARRFLDEASGWTAEVGDVVRPLAGSQQYGLLALHTGDFEAGERLLRESLDGLERLGERVYTPTVLAILADLQLAQGKLDAAVATTLRVEELSPANDPMNFSEARRIRAEALVQRDGREEEAEALARSAVELSDSTDHSLVRANARLALARVLHARGRADEAAAAAAEARELYAFKGDVHYVAQAEALLAELGTPAA